MQMNKLPGANTKLPETSVAERLCNHFWWMFFFLKCMTSLSRSSFTSFPHHTHYLSNQPQSQWKTDIPSLDSDNYSFSQHKQELNLWYLSFQEVAWNLLDLVMVKSGAQLSSVEGRTYFSLIKQFVSHKFFACNCCKTCFELGSFGKL